ncbi:MAG TPA: hypothetical protein VJI33_04170 [Candidatus Paceibacterota bacterium]
MSLPHKKNLLRDVLPKGSSEGYVPIGKNKEENDIVYHKVSEPVIDYGNGGGSRWRIWVLVAVAVFGLTVAVFYVFSSAKITIIPRIDEFAVDNSFKAQIGSMTATSSPEQSLFYSVNTIQKIGTKILDADGEKQVDRKASGTIIIYNKFSGLSQKLIKNTRFETPDGLIYRIDRSIVVPGQTTIDGKVVPGSIEAVVYADEPGTKYNIGMTTFTIPGFKSDSGRYAGFYADSKTPMLDGFSGAAKYVSDSKQKLARAEIRSELEKQILADARAGLDRDSFIPDGAYIIEFETQPSNDATGGKVALKEKATVSTYSFKTFDFDQFIVSSLPFSGELGSTSVEALNRGDLKFSWLSRPKDDSKEISFRVSGNGRFGWMIDKNKLADVMAGKKRGELNSILKEWNGIENATASLSPFWRSSFPDDSNKITITIQIP